MTDLRNELKQYLHDVLGVVATVTPWQHENRLPLFLRDRYRFFVTEILNQQCLLMAGKHEQEESPATIRKHVEQVRSKSDDPVVYVRERITAYNRKRLIEHKVPFVVPGTQMYLPMLGLDLREHFRKCREEKGGLGPAAQVVFIHALVRSAEELSPTVLAERLGYSVMTMSRALDELEAAGLGQSVAIGRTRRLRLAGPKRAVWEKAQSVLRSPVKSRHALQLGGDMQDLPGLRSGLTALAHYSMLAEPKGAVVAFGRKEWASFCKKNGNGPTEEEEPDGMIAEVWAYSPALFACEGAVDRLSLFLCLRDTNDERVRGALDQMIREIAW